MIYPPHYMTRDPAYRPFLDYVMRIEFLTTEEVARRWRFKTASVANMRHNGTGPAFVKVGHSVRYRSREVTDFELYGHGGGLDFDLVAAALATCPDLTANERKAIEAHLHRVLCVKTEG
ncbi:MAG: helix-turn-helix domain-containing protein [Hyphomicrobium sp.]|jgi:hypothetical protein